MELDCSVPGEGHRGRILLVDLGTGRRRASLAAVPVNGAAAVRPAGPSYGAPVAAGRSRGAARLRSVPWTVVLDGRPPHERHRHRSVGPPRSPRRRTAAAAPP